MSKELINKLDNFKKNNDINYKQLHEVFYLLKDMLEVNKDEFNKYFKQFVDILSEKKYDKDIYADFLFIMSYYKDYFDESNNYELYKAIFITKSNFETNQLLDLDIYEKESTVYCYHDGMPIIQTLKINDDLFDILYDMGRNEEKRQYYYKATVNNNLLEKFNNSEISLKELFLLDDVITVKCINAKSKHHYVIEEKDIKEIKEEISDKLFVSFFSDVWGEAEKWDGIVLY